jgi:hypothetical protein
MLRKCACLSLFVLLLISGLFAESRARIVRISHIEGDVAIDRGEGEGFVRAFANMPVMEGLRLWTRAEGAAEVEFEDGSTLRLVPDTLLEFQQLHLDDRGDKISHIDVHQGTVYANVKDHNHDQFVLTSGPHQIALKHSSRFRLVADQDQLSVAVFRGELDVQRDGGQQVKVKKNETLAMDVTDPERYYLSKGITESAFDSWDRDREEQVATLQQQYTEGTPTNYSGNYYGYSDLAYYGGWSTIPGYGLCWQPYGIGSGWNPFGYGAWVAYPGYGYTWVSSYPWGWTPFRFGSWIFSGGRGWFWRPGPRIVNFTNVNVFNPPHGFVPPRPPVVTSGPAVAVVNGGGEAHPANPREAWMPRPGGGIRPVDEDRRNLIPGKRVFGNEDLKALREQGSPGIAGVSNISPRTTTSQAGPAGTPPARPGDDVVTRSTVDRGERIHTRDRDYNRVDYRTRAGALIGASSGGSFMNPARGAAMPMSTPQASPIPPSAMSPPTAGPMVRPSAPAPTIAPASRSAPAAHPSGGSPRGSGFSSGRSAPAGHASSGSHGGGHSR